ncbi:MAG: Fe-S protein assembly chaperone HscA [Myxococcales bacterium]|jgi:molecular chaperone HscA|nr:Fe-S protein assembly chaperone HscA [Myxococcales bacterium]
MSGLLQIEESLTPSRAVGIDLGTTHSLIAARQGNAICSLPVDSQGHRLLPSIVRYDEAADAFRVGSDANAAPEGPTIRSAKRFLGRNLSELKPEDRAIAALAPDSELPRFILGSKRITAVEASAEILTTLRRAAERALSAQVRDAVITVPAYFDDAQRQATKDAGRLAGLNVLRILNEPTAAAIAYGLDKKVNGHFAIFDLGGGTFDLSILSLDDGLFQVLATKGDTLLGGDDFDRALLDLALEKATGKTAPRLDEAGGRLVGWLVEARRVKEALSDVDEAEFSFGSAGSVGGDALDGKVVKLTRVEVESLPPVRALVERTLRLTKSALLDAHLTSSQLDGIVLVGGMTRMPLVRAEVARFFGRPPLVDLDPDEVVAIGAAIEAEQLSGEASDELLLLDVNPLSLGLETMGGVVEKIIPRNSTIPTSAAQIFTTFQDGQTGLDIHVLQGERELVEDCRSLARFRLRGIPPMAAGLARIQVTFALDADGLLSVSARELSTGVEQSIAVKPAHGLSDEDIEEMLMAAIDNAEEDVARRLVRDARVEAQRIAHEAEKRLDDHAFLLVEGERERIERALERVHEASATEDFKGIVAGKNALVAASNKFAERVMTYELDRAIKGRSAEELVADSNEESAGLRHLREQERGDSLGES